jgi:hypothetical protein
MKRFLSFRLPALSIICIALGGAPASAGWLGGLLADVGSQMAKEEQERLRMAQRQLKLELIQACRQMMAAGQQCTPSMLQAINGAGSSSPEQLEYASFVRSEQTGDYSLSQCFYKTYRGYEFSVNFRGSCDGSVRINPETNTVYKNE